MKNISSLEEQFTSYINQIINSNKKYFGFEDDIKWAFFEDDKSLIAKNDISTLFVNINSLKYAFLINQLYMIEFYILHEIRHIYQRKSIHSDLINNPQIQQWKYEFEHYIKPTDNPNAYYNQSIEFDAFSYSYALMLFKYGKIEYISFPKYYTGIIEPCIEKWLENFKNL